MVRVRSRRRDGKIHDHGERRAALGRAGQVGIPRRGGRVAVEQHHGSIRAENMNPGLKITVSLPVSTDT